MQAAAKASPRFPKLRLFSTIIAHLTPAKKSNINGAVAVSGIMSSS
jgi:hypothetical protein